jgi:predicted phage baseplate assembly protein
VSFAPPNLDTRTFDDLVAEAKQRIPRYLPEWTDYNESDPGMVLVELFAWMTEATLFQLNAAPDALRIKLLQLLGFKTRPAQPATTELQFTLASGVDAVVVPAGTRVASSGPPNPDGSPVIFETDRAVVAIGPTLQAAVAFRAGVIVAFFADPAKPKTPLFEPYPVSVATGEEDAIYLCFTYSKPFPAVDVDLAFFLDDAPGDTGHVECTFGHTPTPPATWVWEYYATSGTTGAWQNVALLAEETAALYRSGHVRFRFPGTPLQTALFAGRTEPELADFVALTGTWVRARLLAATYETAPRIASIAPNCAPASQAQTVTGEIVGGSFGTPNQTFPLAHAPVLAGTLELTVDEGLAGGAETWTQVTDFYGSSGDATVYALDEASGTIAFGDNHFGAIPLANATNQNNIVAARYRYGGGSAGNVAIGAITDVQSYVAYVDKVTNPIAASGGADPEAPDETALRAGHEVRATNRAVTADDFEALALTTPGALIARAHALPLTNPSYPGIEVPGAVTLLVVPTRPEDIDVTLQTPQTGPPAPNRTTLEAVCAWLDAHRLVTTELHVAAPVFHTLTFTLTAYVDTDADLAAVSNGIVAALRALYAPVAPDGRSGWAWGATGYIAVAFATAMNVPGVARIDTFAASVDGTAVPTLGDATIAPGDLFWVPPAGVTVTPRYVSAS